MRVLVVEDDFIVRKGIILSLEWEKEGFEICGEAANGIQGFQKVKETHPDIILTDIRMPGEDGLAFSQKVRDAYPAIKIVTLSGYDDFAYAKQALKIGVFEYLLKPVDADELLSVVVRLRKEIEKEQRKYKKEVFQQSFVEENYEYVKERFLNILLEEDSSGDEEITHTIEKGRRLGLNFDGPVFQVVLVSVDDFLLLTQNSKEERKELQVQIKETIREVLHLSEKDMVFLDKRAHFIVLLQYERANATNIIPLYQKIKEKHGFYVTISIGRVKEHVYEIQSSYREALQALRSRPYLSGEHVIQYTDGMKPGKGMFLNIQKRENELIQKLLRYDGDGVLSVIQGILDEALEKHTDLEKLKTACIRVWMIAVSNLEEMSINPEILPEGNYEYLQEIDKYESFETLRRQMLRFGRQISELLASTEGHKYNAIIQKSIQYIENHFSEEIRVEQIVSRLYITPNYFSQVFKSQTGMNFSDYLNQYRVERAKEYLNNLDLKIYQVAEKCGYQNYKYFNTVFKKYAGCSPKEYRNRLSWKNDGGNK